MCPRFREIQQPGSFLPLDTRNSGPLIGAQLRRALILAEDVAACYRIFCFCLKCSFWTGSGTGCSELLILCSLFHPTYTQDILIRERDNATSFIAGIPHCRVIHRIRPTDRRTLQSKHQTRRRSFQIGQIHFRRSLSLDAIAPPPFLFLEVLGVHNHPE